ncbi:sigma-70 family RNA polymerase sigma factor [Blastococcus aurantiacus]|uniref:sigma-70 family RNA polymerase sigma factor n=1 Tax=Blastococcus aurantiacus TaxID=1550231 RepID=UPI0021006FD7|nr:sigma-70 family RNA polymerase sigma factor [Blastococcus aurantiacus]
MDRSDTAADTSFADLLDQYTARAWALARRILGDDRLAEDVVQEAFLAYWRNPAAYDGTRGPFGSWFLALVHHKAVDAVRREESQRRRVDAAAQLAGQDTVRDVAETVADRITDLRVRSALEALPPLQREALVLAYWGGYTQREIAQRTGAPLGTVKTRMFTGMRRLHEGLHPVGAPSVVAPRVAGG